MKNYRYKNRCKDCGKFVSKKNTNHYKVCKPKINGDMFLCKSCGEYKFYENFGRDKEKRYGIRYNCKECRRKAGNGNNARRRRKLLEKQNGKT